MNTYRAQMIDFVKHIVCLFLKGSSGIMYKNPNLPVRIEAILTIVSVPCVL